MTLQQKLAERVKELRKERVWSQEVLATISGLSTRHIQHIEAGTRWPRPATLNKIAKAFEIETEDLFGNDSQATKKPAD